MENRRDFIKKAGLLAGSFGLFSQLPASIQKALAINPELGSTFLDAEHVVLLMQENRSFDHSFGTLQGVRGFNDPRAISLPNKNPVWLQSYRDGKTFAPFRLDIKNSKAAWTSDLPHSWENQMAARNNGKHDNWLEAKRSGRKDFNGLPLTLGYYIREDIPFYYALADAFTICDQHFCSSITGTTTNRHFFWTGTCVPEKGAKPLVRNSDTYYNKLAHWKTFPERLEENHISWKVYQNEISLQNDLDGAAEPWLGNFTDNNLEWFANYQVRFKKSHLDFLHKRIAQLPNEILGLENEIKATANKDIQKPQKSLKQKQEQLESYKREVMDFSEEKFNSLSSFQKALHQKAFSTNELDATYHSVETVKIDDQDTIVPKGDVLYQFRKDVQDKKLPTVSWLVAPQNFSDHPSAPMYGAWYVSEVLKILTDKPEVWKKTIFIINYDENDGYFDHVPPFVAPNPKDPDSGKTSSALDYSSEYVFKEQELASGVAENQATEGPVGLGYRVPLLIVSPWSKGGWVNSEVCDITSTLQFLEVFLNKKFNKEIFEENISSWRRKITGDLTSAFRQYQGEKIDLPFFLDRNQQIANINATKELPAPNGFRQFNPNEISDIQQMPLHHPLLPKQEKGIRPSNALAYELYIDGRQQEDSIALSFSASQNFFKEKSLPSPFLVYSGEKHKDGVRSWTFATDIASINYHWPLTDFDNKHYQLKAYGPNGFYRTFLGNDKDPDLSISCQYAIDQKGIPTGNIELKLKNNSVSETIKVAVLTNAYHNFRREEKLAPQQEVSISIDNQSSHNWYDFSVKLPDYPLFERQFAGRVETGNDSKTDPLMGRI
ncbi:phosphocholine-specific phospholipase C [Sphingobacterium hungaricum]|uniref:phospholipase C n=1 Tax=Sphingobacterium hungaricum TaxID=2082723 RepID=A0A928YPA6_9SPHI|nr:phospholipase C, phosphocholine-specific [Sphingobacterium hungaricum]MBE8712916.1 phospholipase C, phosphocholine-specific [Sphingobacterium hungaricum]